MEFLGIDVGTSFIKGAVLDVAALTLRHVQRIPFPDPIRGLPTWQREYDPGLVVEAVRQLIDGLLTVAPGSAGLVMCSQLHGTVLTTERGDPLSNLITWQDERALQPHPSGQGSYLERLTARLGQEKLRVLGNELRACHPVSYLFWLSENGQMPSSNALPTALPDFLLARLSDSSPGGVELTNAMAYGVLNLETLQWDQDAIAALGLDGLRWPRLRAQGEVVCEIKAGGRSLPCYTPVGDGPAALVGVSLGCEELSINIGTGSQVTRITSEPVFGDYQTRPFFDGRFLNTVTNIPAGRALDDLMNLLTEIATAMGCPAGDAWPYVERAAAAVTTTDLAVDLAFFAGAYGSRGAITNIREENLSAGHLFRAAFESMAANYFRSAVRLWPDQSWQSLVLSGGLSQRSRTLRDTIAARFGTPYRVSVCPEETLLGLLALARTFGGKEPSVRAAMAHLREHER